MSNHSTAHARLASRRLALRSLRLSSACVAVLATAAGAGVADAQTAQPADASGQTQAGNQVKEVVVTGIRRSLQDSVAAKRLSDEVVEVISAEDIGKLPDESIADSLTRLPGLAGQRVDGRYQDISIRGLSSDFTATLLNGYQQASTGDSRAAEFDQYPSELINGVTVYKTPDPSLVGAGLAGTVDLHTLNPLDLGKRVFAIDLRGSVNSQGKLTPGSSVWGNRISGAYIDQFFGGRVGVAIGVAHLDAPEQERHYQAWFWGAQGNLLPAADAGAQGVQASEDYAYSRSVVRDGVMATLEFKPTSTFHSINNFFYSKFNQGELMRGEEWIEGGNSAPNQTITNPVYQKVGGNVLNTGGTINSIVPILISDYNTRNDNEFSYISRNTWDGADWRLGGDVSYSYAERQESQMEQYAQYGATGTPDSVTFSNTAATNGFPQFKPGLNYADTSKIYLDCPSPWGGCWGHDGLLHNPTTRDTFIEGKLYARHELTGWGSNLFKTVELGADYSDRVKKKTEDDYNLFLKGSMASGVFDPKYTMALPSDVVAAPTNLGWAGWGNLFGYDPRKTMKYYTAVPIDDENQFQKTWQVEEQLATFYAKLNIRTEMFGLPTTGNLGLQYVYANQISQGFDTTALTGTGTVDFKPFTSRDNYGEFLPTFNLKFQIPGNQYVHLGVARELSRPRLDDLRANASGGASLPTDPSTMQPCKPGPSNPTCLAGFSGSGGNPKLRPWLADAFDATYEKYLSKTSYIAVNFYHKELLSYIYKQTMPNYNFAGYPNPLSYPIGSYLGPFTQPANGRGGHVEGLEISGTLDANLATHWLDGFGVTGSFARAWTNISQTGPAILPNGTKNPFYDATAPLLGLSGTVTSWTVFYEKYGFSARLSQRYRSPYRADVGGLFATLNQVEVGADESMDAQVSYDIPWGPLKGMTLLVQGYNITNSPYRQFYSAVNGVSATNLNYYKDYGRTILFGVHYKY